METIKNLLIITIFLTFGGAAFAQDCPDGRITGQAVVEFENGNTAQIWARIFNNSDSPSRRMFRYEYGDEEVFIHVHYLRFEESYAWFAGQVTQDSTSREGRWLFAAVHDGGSVSHLWWQWFGQGDDAERRAREKVQNLEIPDRNVPIKSGNLSVECF